MIPKRGDKPNNPDNFIDRECEGVEQKKLSGLLGLSGNLELSGLSELLPFFKG